MIALKTVYLETNLTKNMEYVYTDNYKTLLIN